MTVTWLPWSADAFAQASAERKPVLLSITTTWSHACSAMDAECYADPALAALVSDGFVPIRVDADRRPDISERYSRGGWPTTAFLTSRGAVIGGGTYVPRVRFEAALRRVLAAFHGGGIDIARADETVVEDPIDAGVPRGDPADEQALQAAVFATFDAEHGGFGTAPKFPLTAPIRLALHLHRDRPDERIAHVAAASLDAIGWGPLHDDVDGGFFRCAQARSWQSPHLEKLLHVNAALIDLYVEAAEMVGAGRYADRAQDALRYAQNWLADQVDGGWGASQRSTPVYYARPLEGAVEARQPPALDRTLYASWNGAMVSAALRAAYVFDDEALGRFALTSLERVLATCYTPGDGVAHYVFGGRRTAGMLDDQVAIAVACLDAFEATGNVVYQMMAEELARHAQRTMWDAARGAFFDRTLPDQRERVGLMGHRLTPFVGNCETAAMLSRLAASTGNREFADLASSILAAVSPTAVGQGPDAAHYLLALRAVKSR